MLLCGVFALSLVFASMFCRSLDVIGKSRRDSSEFAEFFRSRRSFPRSRRNPSGVRFEGSELARSFSEVGGVILDSSRSWRNRRGILLELAESTRTLFEVGGIDAESFRSWRNRLRIFSKLAESIRNPFKDSGVLLYSSRDPCSGEGFFWKSRSDRACDYA